MRISVRTRLALSRLREAGGRAVGRVLLEREVQQDFWSHPVAAKGGPPAASGGSRLRGSDGMTFIEKTEGGLEEN